MSSIAVTNTVIKLSHNYYIRHGHVNVWPSENLNFFRNFFDHSFNEYVHPYIMEKKRKKEKRKTISSLGMGQIKENEHHKEKRYRSDRDSFWGRQ